MKKSEQLLACLFVLTWMAIAIMQSCTVQREEIIHEMTLEERIRTEQFIW